MNTCSNGNSIACTIDTNIYNPEVKNSNQLKRVVQNGIVGVNSGRGGGGGGGVGGGIINGGYCFNDNIALHLIDYGGSIVDPLSSSTAGQIVGDGERLWCDSDVDMLLLRRQSVAGKPIITLSHFY